MFRAACTQASTRQPAGVTKPNRKCCVNGKVESGALIFALSRSYIGLYRNAGIVEYFSVPI